MRWRSIDSVTEPAVVLRATDLLRTDSRLGAPTEITAVWSAGRLPVPGETIRVDAEHWVGDFEVTDFEVNYTMPSHPRTQIRATMVEPWKAV